MTVDTGFTLINNITVCTCASVGVKGLGYQIRHYLASILTNCSVMQPAGSVTPISYAGRSVSQPEYYALFQPAIPYQYLNNAYSRWAWLSYTMEAVSSFLEGFSPLFYLKTPSTSSFKELSEVPNYVQEVSRPLEKYFLGKSQTSTSKLS